MTSSLPKVPVKELRRLSDSGASLTAAARERGIPYPRLREQIVAAGLPIPRAGARAGTTQYPGLTKTFLNREYVRGKKSTVTIAAEVGCSDSTVRTALERCGIPRRGRGRRRAPAALTEKNLRRWYVDKEETMTRIAARVGTTVDTVSAHLVRYGIPIRATQQHRVKDIDEKMLEKLFTAGTSYQKMAAALGVSVGKFHNRVGELGWTR